MYKLFSKFSISSLFKGHAVDQSILTFIRGIPRAFKAVNQRSLSAIGTTLMLSALLSACSSGGGSDAPAPAAPTTLIFSVSSSNFSVDEDFTGSQLVASVTNATSITVSQSNTGVVTVTTSNSQVNVSSIANVNGRTTLTITATDGTLIAIAQVTVTVNAINDPPTLTASSNNISTVGGFSPITINTTASDIEDANLTFTVAESTTGVVRVGTSADAIILSNIPNASGQTILTITVVDSSGSTVTQTIPVNVTITTSTSIPALSVSTTLVNEQEDFGSVVIRTTATDADGDAIRFSVSPLRGVVDAVVSTSIISTNTITNRITLSAVANANGTTTLTILAADVGGQSTEVNIVVVIAAVNDAPTFTIPTPDLALAEDFMGARTVISADDVDSNTLTITVVESTTGVVTVTTSASSVQVASILNANGQTTLTITVNDGTNDTTAQVAVSVTAINDAPSLNISTTNVVVDEDFANTLSIATATDVENNTLTISVAESTTGVVTVTTSASSVQVASILNANGQTTLTITVNDGTVDTTAQVVVTVNSVNDTPTLTVSNNNITTVADFSTITINTTASDVDEGALSFSVQVSTAGVVTVTTSTNAIILNAVAGSTGQTSIVVRTADSGGLTATQTIAVNVMNATTPTLMVSTNRINVQEDFGSSVVIRTTATDSSGGSIALSVNPASSIVNVVVSTPLNGISTITNTITLTAINNANGTSTLTVQSASAGGQTTSTEIVVVVASVNDTPTLTIPNANLVIAEDFSGNSMIATAVDIDGDTPIFSVVESITGLVTVSISADGVFVSSILNARGQTTLTITVRDGSLSSTAQVVVTVTEVNDPPALIISTATFTTMEDFAGGITVATASDVDNNPLTFSVIESTTGVIRVTASASDVRISSLGDANGVTTLSISVSDGRTVSSTAQVVVTVTPINDPPVISVSTNALTLLEDFATVLIATTRSDVDSNTLTYTLAQSATGVVTIQTSTSGISVSSIEHQSGRTTLTLTLSDNELISTTQVVVDVTAVNDPPVLTVSTAALTLNEDFGAVLIATTRSDLDSNTLTLTVAESTTGVVTVQASTSEISVSSIENRNGRTTLTITLSDNELISTTQVVVTVSPINDTPTLTIPSVALTVAEDFASTLTIATANDVDGDTLNIIVAESSTGVVRITTSASGVQIISLRDVSGQTTLMITVSDSTLSSTTQVVVTVTPINDTPTLNVTTNALAFNEDFATTEVITVTRSDVDGDTLTLSVSESTTGVVSVSTSSTGIQVVSIADTNGQTTLTITVGDGTVSTSTQVVVDVTAVNDPPVLSVSTVILTLAEDFPTVLIATTRTDIDSTTLTLTVTESNAGVVTATTTDAGIQVANIANVNGQTTLAITLSDGELNTTIQVVVAVTPINDPPSLTVSTIALSLTEDFPTVLIATTRTDIDSNTLTLAVTESNAGVVTATTTDAGIQVANIANANGRTTLTVRVADGDGLFATTDVLVVVNAVNDPPVLTVSTTALTLTEDFATVLIATTRTDIDSTTLTLTVAESATGVVTVQISTSEISVSSIENINGSTTLTITLSDGELSTTTQVVVAVTPVNDPPVLTVSTTALTLAEDFATVLIATTRTDIDNNTLTLTVTESTAGVVNATITDAGIQVSNIANANGRTTLAITLSDGVLSTTTQVVVTVTPVNNPPVLTVSTTALTLAEDFVTTEIITVTRSDVDGDTLTLTVSESSTGVVTVTTSASGVQVASIPNANGRTTLTIRVTDGDGLFDTTDVLVVVNDVDDPPVLTVSTNLILVDEDFSSPVVIRTTATDADGDALIVSISSSSRLVDAVLSTPVNGMSIITNMITLSAMTDLNGTTTLTIQAIDAGGTATTEQIVVVVNAVDDPIPFTLSTTAVSLSIHGSQLDRIVNAISINNSGNQTLRAQIGVTASGDNIFSANPAPVVSFTTNALTAVTTLTSTTPTAQLYFTIVPNRTGTATLTVHLTNLDDSSTSQQTMVVSVNSPNVPPEIVAASPSITNLVVHGGHLYANDVSSSNMGISRFLTTASALGGHLMNINSVEEFSFMSSAASGLIFQEAWLGMVLPNRLFPGELSWMTHDSTIGYGYARSNGAANLTVYPGHFNLSWFPNFDLGLRANRTGNTATVSNWAVHATAVDVFFLVDDGGDFPVRFRNVIYEFPQGITATSIQPITLIAGTSATVRLTGFDLNSDTINTNDWSITDSNGGSAVFNPTAGNTGVQTVNMVYTPPANFAGQTTVVVTLQVNGLSTTNAISFIVDEPPTIALSTRNITLAEDFGTFDIGTTVTDRLMSTSLPFSVSASPSGILTITTSANNIQLSAVSNANGTTTITVQAMDARGQSSLANVVVVVTPVNDPPVLAVSTTALILNEDFGTVLIATTRSDLDGDNLTLTVSESTTGVVTVTTTVAGVQVANIANANGQTTLTITLSDGRASVSTQVLVTVNAVNDPPVLTVSTIALTLTEDFATTEVITITRSDVDGDNLTLTVSESTTGVITVTTTVAGVQVANIANANGQTTLTITLSDSRASVSTQVLVTVNAVNDPPVLSVSTIALTLTEDFATTEVITITRSDADGDILTLTVSESATGVVTVTTSASGVQVASIANANGQTTLTITVGDGTVSVSTQVLVTVNAVNDPPVLSVSPDALTLNEDFATTEVLTVTRSDVDGDTLILTVAESATGVVTVTTSASGVQVANIANANGQTILTITVGDGTVSVSTQVLVTVNAVNDPPVLTVSTIALTLTEDFATTEVITITRSDVDGDNLTLTVAESTTGVVTVTTTVSGVQVASIADANGQTTLTITVGDGTANVSTQVLVTVNAVNDPPVLSVSTDALALAEDFATTEVITVIRNDVDGDNLTLTVAESATGVVTVTTSATGIQVISIADANGQTTLTITVGDGTVSVSTQVLVTVNAVNDPPVLSVSPDTLTLNEDFATTEVITITRSDVDGDTLTLTVAESATGVVTVTTSATGVQVASIANANGQTTLTITVGDGTVSVSTQVLVTVNAVNDPPVLTVSTTALTLFEDFATTEVITVTRSDIDSSTLTLIVAESATGVVSVSTSSAGVQVVSIANANGQTTLTITVGDGTVSVSTQVLVTVNAVNDPPVLTVSTTALTLFEDFATTEVITVTRSDIDSSTLTLIVAESATGVVSVSTSSAGVQVVSIANANGQTTLTITVGDGTASVSTQVLVTVNAVNDPPVLSVSIDALTLAEDFATTEVLTVNRSDVDGDALTLTVSESTTGVVSASTSSAGVQVISIADANGQTTLTITVGDGTVSISTQVVVDVTAINDPPVLTVSTTALTLAEDFATPILIGTTRTDVDSTTLTLTVSESATEVITITITDAGVQVANNITNANGRTTLTITLSDGILSTTAQVVIDVTEVNDTPMITVSTNSVTLGSASIDLTVSTFDVEDSTLSFSVSTGQGVVNTAIINNRLTITRLDFSPNAPQIMLTLRTTDTGGLSAFTIVTVLLEPMFIVTTGIKTLDFDWSAISSATHYQLQSEPMNGSGFTDLSTAGVVVSPNSTNIRESTAQALIALHRYIPNVINPQYGVNTCDATSCGASFVHNTVSLTNAQLNSLIGRLQASDVGGDDRFGASLSLSDDGNILAVGAWSEDGSATGVNGAHDNTVPDSGAVYLFRRNGGVWSQQAYIKASNTGASDIFGFSVSLSGDGNTLAVGAYFEDGSGAAYVFRFNTTSNNWSQQAYIKASNIDTGDNFGISVSLNGDGNILAVGATDEDGLATGVNGAQNNNASNSGAVYLYRFSTGSSSWSQQAYIKASNVGTSDRFGSSVSLSADGNTLAVGAGTEDSSGTGVNGAHNNNNAVDSGAAYVFRFNTISKAWAQQAYFKASNTVANDFFGASISLSGDGNTLAVGATGEDSSATGVNGAQNNNDASRAGAVYLFRFSTGSSSWFQQAYIKASNTGTNDRFGSSVSLSADGNTLAVGALFEDGSATNVGGADDNGTDNAGAVYVFEFGNGAWVQHVYIKATDTAKSAFFGTRVLLSSSGNTLVVGATGVSSSAGAVYLY